MSDCDFSGNEILDRIKGLLNFKKDNELADFFQIAANKIATWRTRNHIPYRLIIQKAREGHFDLNHIFGVILAERNIFCSPDTNSRISLLETENKELKIKLSYAEELIFKKNISLSPEEKGKLLRRNDVL